MPRYPNHALPLRGAADLKGYALCRRPPVNMQLVTGRTCNEQTYKKTSVIWAVWELHFDILGVHLGTLGHYFGDPGVPKDTQQDTLESRPG